MEVKNGSLGQLKDFYQQREKESDDRHRDELRDVKMQHAREIEKVRSDANETMSNQRNESQAKLTAKDAQNAKEIDNIRAMYQKKIAASKSSKDSSES